MTVPRLGCDFYTFGNIEILSQPSAGLPAHPSTIRGLSSTPSPVFLLPHRRCTAVAF